MRISTYIDVVLCVVRRVVDVTVHPSQPSQRTISRQVAEAQGAPQFLITFISCLYHVLSFSSVPRHRYPPLSVATTCIRGLGLLFLQRRASCRYAVLSMRVAGTIIVSPRVSNRNRNGHDYGSPCVLLYSPQCS